MKKYIEYFVEHPIRCIFVVFLILSIAPPLFIHSIYKIPAFLPFFEEVIPPGNMLAYLGTVMTFCATFSLSILVYRQNIKNAERAELAENKTFITVDIGECVELCTPSVKDEMSLMFDMEINALSEARCSKINLQYIGIRDETILKASKNYSIAFLEKRQPVHFQYINKNRVKLSLGILKVEESVKNLLQEIDMPTIGLDVEFICENVLTPITITLILCKNEEITNGISFIYNVSKAYVHHHKERFV